MNLNPVNSLAHSLLSICLSRLLVANAYFSCPSPLDARDYGLVWDSGLFYAHMHTEATHHGQAEHLT